MKKSDRSGLILYGILSLVVLCVIYGQSMLPPKESGEFSGFVVTFLKPLLDPFSLWEADVFHLFIRKLGHFTEYAFFSFFFGKFSSIVGKQKKKQYISLPLLVMLSVAVSDEFLQSFTGRGSSVADIVLDFAGGVFGLLFVSFFGYLSYKRSKIYETGL